MILRTADGGLNDSGIAITVLLAEPVPAMFTAETRKVYVVPAVSGDTTAERDVLTPSANVVHVAPESVEYSTT